MLMQIIVSGQHMPMPESVQKYVKNKTQDVLTKYFANVIDAHVHFSKQGNDIACDIIAHDGTGKHRSVIKSRGIAHEMCNAFDKSLDKLEHQIQKLKSKMNDYHKSRASD